MPGSNGRRALLFGALLSGLTTYGYQVLGVRAIGESEYAIVSVLWTLQYLAFALLLQPLEAFVASDPARHLRTACLWVVAVAAAVAVLLLRYRGEYLYDSRSAPFLGGLIVLSYGAFCVCRGLQTANSDTNGYALLTGGEASARLALTPLVVAVSATGTAVAWLLPVGPPLVLLALAIARRPSTGPRRVAERADRPGASGSRRRLAAGLFANGGAQIVLAAGPLLVPVLGGTPREVTQAFVTLTAARLPVFLALGGLLGARLPALLASAAAGRVEELRAEATRTAAAGLLLSVPAGIVGALVGPPMLGLVFGEQVRPPALVAGLITSGVALTLASLMTNQVLGVLGRASNLVFPWCLALVAAGCVLQFTSQEALPRIAWALVAGEAVGLVGLTLAAHLFRGGRPELSET